MSLVPAAEPSDCWRLVGVDDPSTPPSVSRVLFTVGTRAEWRRAGFPVLFDEAGRVRHVVRGGRVYRFEPVPDALHGGAARHPDPASPC